jgi:hypothetical protein
MPCRRVNPRATNLALNLNGTDLLQDPRYLLRLRLSEGLFIRTIISWLAGLDRGFRSLMSALGGGVSPMCLDRVIWAAKDWSCRRLSVRIHCSRDQCLDKSFRKLFATLKADVS